MFTIFKRVPEQTWKPPNSNVPIRLSYTPHAQAICIGGSGICFGFHVFWDLVLVGCQAPNGLNSPKCQPTMPFEAFWKCLYSPL